MENKGKYYLTTAIAYTSGKPHIGNVYEIVLADSIARYKRMTGYDVRFQTGTDEHGQKVEEKAKAAGLSPKEFTDKVSAVIKEQFDVMNVSYDHFIRTTDPYHENRYRRSSANYMTRAIFTKASMKVCIARSAKHSIQRAS